MIRVFGTFFNKYYLSLHRFQHVVIVYTKFSWCLFLNGKIINNFVFFTQETWLFEKERKKACSIYKILYFKWQNKARFLLWSHMLVSNAVSFFLFILFQIKFYLWSY